MALVKILLFSSLALVSASNPFPEGYGRSSYSRPSYGGSDNFDPPPSSNYGPPRNSYGPPQNSYRFFSQYGPGSYQYQEEYISSSNPILGGLSSYGRANYDGSTQEDFDQPSSDIGPTVNYGYTSSNYGPPRSSYGRPQNNYETSPSHSNGPPKNSYGPHVNSYERPRNNYGSPSQYGHQVEGAGPQNTTGPEHRAEGFTGSSNEPKPSLESGVGGGFNGSQGGIGSHRFDPSHFVAEVLNSSVKSAAVTAAATDQAPLSSATFTKPAAQDGPAANHAGDNSGYGRSTFSRPSYGVTPQETYDPPRSYNYGPTVNYTPLKNTYGPYSSYYQPPRSSYGRPQNNYDAYPSNSYGPPKNSYVQPVSSYGRPRNNYGSPTQYGPGGNQYPAEGAGPHNSYGFGHEHRSGAEPNGVGEQTGLGGSSTEPKQLAADVPNPSVESTAVAAAAANQTRVPAATLTNPARVLKIESLSDDK